MTREPSDESVLAARLQRAYPSLSPYSSASLAQQLCAIERMQRRHAERCCSGADGGYVRRKPVLEGGGAWPTITVEHDPDAEERAGKRIERAVHAWNKRLAELHELAWTMTEHTHGNWRCTLQDGTAHRKVVAEWTIGTEGDPRGAVLKVRFPNESEATSV